MRTETESDKLYKARELKDKIVKQLLVYVKQRNFPVYYDKWVSRLLQIENLIIDLKYK